MANKNIVKKVVIGTNSKIENSVSTSIHAEDSALNKYLRMVSLTQIKQKQVDIVVIGYNSLKNIRMSRPCYHCLLKLQMSNIKIRHIYYRTVTGTIMREPFHQMLHSNKTYMSGGNRYMIKCRLDKENKKNKISCSC
jgi:cytidine deaminase